MSLNVLLKSISYFNYKTINIFGNTENTMEKIKIARPDISFVQSKADVIFTTIENFEFRFLDSSQLHNNTLLLVDNIHQNKNNFDAWEKLKERAQVTVTIDLFYCGAVFFRKEQVKEHFKIRI
ncbi:hypothetical protein ACNR9Q_08935 [Maribacter sp. X9]|uniref:hypothetical protein n=1 Tax=Maribacter sp. X9 TaxID=3402159 RepID=UPI003AF3E5ED